MWDNNDMSADVVLGSYEAQAEESITLNERDSSDEIVFTGNGKKSIHKNKKSSFGSKLKKFGALGFGTIIILTFLLIFGTANILSGMIPNSLLEGSDQQYTNEILSKEYVFQQAMVEGDIPDNTARLLKEDGIIVGYIQDGEFIEGNVCSNGCELQLRMGDKIITADTFLDEVNSDARLYYSFNKATYGRVAGWYDEAADEIIKKKYNTNRNNFSEDSSLEEVMNRKLGKGSDINVSSVSVSEDGQGKSSTATNNSGDEAGDFIKGTIAENKASNIDDATLSTADTLKAADTITREQRSGTFALLLLENINKMQAGDGNESKINEVMNYLYEETTNSVVDTKTAQLTEVTGSAMEAPSLYAMLSGGEINAESVGNYSNDRILQTIKNQLTQDKVSTDIIDNTVTSTKKSTGNIGRLVPISGEVADENIVNTVTPTVSSSLSNNGFETINGIPAGEMLVEGVINVSKDLARASGGAPGDESAVKEYARLNSQILAMEAKADRLNRSPFDISSKNTFLGSIVYNLAISMQSKRSYSLISGVASLLKTTASAFASIMPTTSADETSTYLSTIGNCETIERTGAVGSVQCIATATFDESTLSKGIFADGSLYNQKIRELGCVGDNGEVVAKSVCADYIDYYINSDTPVGITNGKTIDDLVELPETLRALLPESVSDFIVGILKKNFVATTGSEVDKKASGAMYVDSSENQNWEDYKWVQRYMSSVRTVSMLRQYAVNDDGRVAYDFSGFDWRESPVLAYIRENNSNNSTIGLTNLTDDEKEQLSLYIEEYPELAEWLGDI